MNLKSNINKNYLYLFLSNAGLSNAIWVLFLAYRGMSLVQIGILEAIFHITSFIMEIPTGIIADKFGRKTSRVIGRLMAFLSTIIMIKSYSFISFAFALAINAISYNLESGAGDALIYDTLLTLKEEKEYMKIKGIQEIFYQGASIFALLVGGYIATYSYETAYKITLLINLAALIQSLWFIEPKIHKKDDINNLTMLTHIKQSVSVIKNNKQIITYMMFIEGFSILYTTLYFYIQNYFKSLGHTEFWIGSFIATASLLSIIGSANAYKIENLLGRNRLIICSGIFSLLLFAVIGFSNIEVIGFLLLSIVESLLFVIFSDYINQLIPSESRATLLSFQAMIFSIMMIILFPLVGFIADTFQFKTAFKFVFFIYIPIFFITGNKLQKQLKKY